MDIEQIKNENEKPIIKKIQEKYKVHSSVITGYKYYSGEKQPYCFKVPRNKCTENISNLNNNNNNNHNNQSNNNNNNNNINRYQMVRNNTNNIQSNINCNPIRDGINLKNNEYMNCDNYSNNASTNHNNNNIINTNNNNNIIVIQFVMVLIIVETIIIQFLMIQVCFFCNICNFIFVSNLKNKKKKRFDFVWKVD